MALRIKRIYEPADESDGTRLLVDRLWPRGVSKERARLDGWEKDLAPSTQLRTWFGHMAKNFDQFTVLYQAELDSSPKAQQAARRIAAESRAGTVTLLYGAKDPLVNHATVLRDYIGKLAAGGDKEPG